MVGINKSIICETNVEIFCEFVKGYGENSGKIKQKMRFGSNNISKIVAYSV
jgi:hypothetical protein